MDPYYYLEDTRNDIKTALDRYIPDESAIVVYDIDDTLIGSNSLPITPIIDSYNYARQKGFNTAIITARPGFPQNIEQTDKQLRDCGISGYSFIFMLPPGKTDQAKFKLHARKHLHDLGHRVIVSVGDMPWDIGAYGGDGFRIWHSRPTP
jgi:hypothetical protein